MFVKAIKKGFYDTAKNGRFTEVPVGMIFEIPDKAKVGLWMVKCDKSGKVIDPDVARKEADAARRSAEKEEAEALLATNKAKREREAANAAEKHAKDLAQQAAANKV